jgi:hypothetical protein
MTIVIFHGSPNKLTFQLNFKKLINQNMIFDYFQFEGFKRVVFLLNAFVFFHLPC